MKNKSVINSHKELQVCLVAAFTFGLDAALNNFGFFFSYDSSDEDYIFIQLWKSATESEKGDGRCLKSLPVNRNSVEMNDIRLFHVAKYLEQHSYEFMKECQTFIKQERPTPVK